ncbi:acetyl-coenzyme A synthetase N-terminal domain-containing protein, partial [Marivita sp.]|uniref:acetyl-coenzyme A synthetase N-terminal domain-containing protein n=1 Tax=Marivita sp. TaxID=2003365 RepID=UPI0025C20B53
MKDQTTTTEGTAVYPPSSETVARAHVDAGRYEEMYARSVSDPEGFWAEQAQRLDW